MQCFVSLLPDLQKSLQIADLRIRKSPQIVDLWMSKRNNGREGKMLGLLGSQI